MAEEKPKKVGKLNFNPMMFNPAAMKPGAKNKKLEELKKVNFKYIVLCITENNNHINIFQIETSK